MPAPNGTRTSRFHINGTDDVHVYSDADNVRLQLRRHVPTQQDIESPSFKVALVLTPEQAIAIAGELLTAATCHHLAGAQNPSDPPTADPVPDADKEDPAATPDEPAAPADPPDLTRRGRPWTEAEEEHLLEAFDGGMSIPQLARTHQRGVWGVQARLVKRGRLTLEQCEIFESDPSPAASFPEDAP